MRLREILYPTGGRFATIDDQFGAGWVTPATALLLRDGNPETYESIAAKNDGSLNGLMKVTVTWTMAPLLWAGPIAQVVPVLVARGIIADGTPSSGEAIARPVLGGFLDQESGGLFASTSYEELRISYLLDPNTGMPWGNLNGYRWGWQTEVENFPDAPAATLCQQTAFWLEVWE